MNRMRIAAALCCSVLLAGCSVRLPVELSPTPSTSQTASPASTPAPVSTPTATPVPVTECSPSAWVHVYRPSRLTVLADCVTVSGIIEMQHPEPDGDVHVLLHLDGGQRCDGKQCTNEKNSSSQLGDLVVEPVCEHEVTQADAVAACSGYENPIAVPSMGAHIRVTGPWVVDTQHGWLEIHPAEQLIVTAS
ncbi:MAG: hypothetical protein ABR498_07690 [Candidatus Dormibacteria bacterium]